MKRLMIRRMKILKKYWLLLIKKVIMNIIIEIQNVSCPNQMLAATLFAGDKCIGVQMLLATLLATNKCVGGQMLIKIYLFGGRFFVRNEVKMKVEKYKSIYENKKKARKNVYNFVFGKVLGKEKTFLIQNIFPTTEEYIESK